MSSAETPVVNSYNEWDPLEEVIVGHVHGAMIPAWDEIDHASHPKEEFVEWWREQNTMFPAEDIAAATKELDELVHVLEGEGVKVRRPGRLDFTKGYSTLDWSFPSGFNATNPRDLLIVAGQEIIESPTPRKGRVFEVHAYRELLREYEKKGGGWISAPRPVLGVESFRQDLPPPKAFDKSPNKGPLRKSGEPINYPLSEHEPMFEAADFMRCGRDIFYHLSMVTNQSGVDWLARRLGPEYKFHEVETLCRRPIHIDTTLVPLAPGFALANPEFMPNPPEVLKKWEIIWAPKPVPRPDYKSPFKMSSDWLSMNVFSIDERRVVIDALQEELYRKLKDRGFEPIKVHFQRVYPFGGGLHCATLDVRRRGGLQSYF